MPHTIQSFDAQLKILEDMVFRMGRLALSQFERSLETLKLGDCDLANRVISGDDDVDALNAEVDRQVLRVLALQSPVANDLRQVIASMKCAISFERIADYSASIANRACTLASLPPMPAKLAVLRMGEMVAVLLSDMIRALEAADTARAAEVWRGDIQVDEQYAGLFRQLITYMMEDSRAITASTHLLFIAKNIERIGDLSTAVGEMLMFQETGSAPDGPRPKADDSSYATGRNTPPDAEAAPG